jgi:hypothetical protein
MPVIQRLRSVSTFSTPSTWTVDTDRGPPPWCSRSRRTSAACPSAAAC